MWQHTAISSATDLESGWHAIHDDFLIGGCGDTDDEAEADHDRNLKAFVERARECNLRLNADKLKLKMTQVPYIGHLLTREGLRVDPKKVEAIEEMPAPKDAKAVPTTITYRDYNHFREDAYSADVSKIPETVCQIFDDPSDNYWALQLLLTDVINEHAPLKTTKVKAREVPFMNKRLKRAVREKTRMYNQYRKRPTPANWEQYRLQRNLTVTIRRDAIKAYFNDKCTGGAKNTDFWPTIKPFLTNKGAGGKSTIMVRVNDKIITDPAHVSQHMNDFYVNIASKIGGDIDVNQTSAPVLTAAIIHANTASY